MSRRSGHRKRKYLNAEKPSNPVKALDKQVVEVDAELANLEVTLDRSSESGVAANQANIDYDEVAVPASRRKSRNWKYELVAIAGLILIWLPALLFLSLSSPVFKSQWTIVIPGTTTGSSINIDSIGEAKTTVDSQYGGKAIDPKVNYKAVLLSSTVLEGAASRSDMEIEEFGKPKVKLVDQTAMMEVVTQADTRELAKLKAQNLYKAFMDELEELRAGERIIKQNSSQSQLVDYQSNVDKAQEALQQYRASSEIVSTEQYRTLISNVGELTEKLRNSETEFAAVSAKFNALVLTLGMDPESAAIVLKLRQDLMVQSQLRAYAQAHAMMTEEAAILGGKHPKVVHARSRTRLAYGALLERADEVLGFSSKHVLDQFMPNAESIDSTLYAELIRLQGDQAALQSEVLLLEQKLPDLNKQILRFSDEAAKLEELERNHQIASTILVSATARLDLGKSDNFASYPLTQLLVAPSAQNKPSRLKTLFVLLGALAGTVLVIMALLIVRYRKLWLQLIQKSG